MAQILVLNSHVMELFKLSQRLTMDVGDAKKRGDWYDTRRLVEQVDETKKKMRHVAVTMGKVKQLGGCDIG